MVFVDVVGGVVCWLGVVVCVVVYFLGEEGVD